MMAMLVMILMSFSDDEDDEMKMVVTLVACLPLTDADVKSKCKRCMQICTLMIRIMTKMMKKVEIGITMKTKEGFGKGRYMSALSDREGGPGAYI